MQKVHNLKINWILFRNRFCFQDIGGFFFVISIQDVLFAGICSVLEHVIVLTIQLSSTMNPPPRA